MTRPIAGRKRRAHVAPCKMKVGASAPPGELYLKEPTPPHQPRTARGTGHMVGRCTHRGSIPNIIAIACSCLPCRSVPRRCSAHRLGHTREHGSPPHLANRPPRCRPKQCRSRCGDAYGCRSRSAPTVAGPTLDAGDQSTPLATTPSLAPKRASWPVAPRAWVRVAREAVGAEGQVVPQQWLTYTTAPAGLASDRRRLDLVVYAATAHRGALCCDATFVSPLTRTGHPQPCTAEVDGAALQVAERRKRVAYPELSRGGPQKLLVLGCEVGGRWRGRSASSATWCASELSARPLPCELPRLQAGRGAGGEHSPWRSSSPWRAQHLDANGRRPRNQERATACPWIVFSTLPRPRGPAVSPAALSRDRAWQRGNLAVAPGFGDWGQFRAGIKVRRKKKSVRQFVFPTRMVCWRVLVAGWKKHGGKFAQDWQTEGGGIPSLFATVLKACKASAHWCGRTTEDELCLRQNASQERGMSRAGRRCAGYARHVQKQGGRSPRPRAARHRAPQAQLG